MRDYFEVNEEKFQFESNYNAETEAEKEEALEIYHNEFSEQDFEEWIDDMLDFEDKNLDFFFDEVDESNYDPYLGCDFFEYEPVEW